MNLKKSVAICLCVIVMFFMITGCASPASMKSQSLANALTPRESPRNDQPGQSIENVDQHCTVFYAADDHVALGGNNEDGYHPVLTRIWFVPPEEGRFGMALVGFDDFSNPEGAINDQGLFYDGLAVKDTEVPLREGTPSYTGNAIMKIMTECGTVQCALRSFEEYSLPGHWNGQWFLGDSHGNSAIIEPMAIVQKEGRFQVATNFFQSEVPPADRTDPRYVAATRMLKNADEFSVDLFQNTLDVVHQQYDGDSVNPPVHTLYSTIYDLKQGVIYLYYFYGFQHVVKFDLKKELAKGIHSYDISSLFPASSTAVELGGKTPAELADLRAGLRQATVDPNILIKYEGNYQLEALPSYLDGKISVKSENDRLFFRQPWMPWVEGIPQSNEDFIYLFSDPNGNLHELNFSFVKDASGQVTKLEVSTDEREKMPAIKVSSDFTKVDAYIDEIMQRFPIPGLSLAIVKGDQILYMNGYGTANPHGDPVTPQTPFPLASVTKSFTALAVRQLAHAGKLDLDQSVQTYLPEFRLADEQAAASITVRHLLDHTSGISRTEGEEPYLNSPDTKFPEALDRLARFRPKYKPGKHYDYSNWNYSLLGEVIGRVSGETYGEYVQKNIFDPLEMYHASPVDYHTVPGAATGNLFTFGISRPYDEKHIPVMSGAAYLTASAEDLAHYVIPLLKRGQYHDQSLLPAQGEGWYDTYWNWHPGRAEDILSSHSGGHNSISTSFELLFPQEVGVVVLMNTHLNFPIPGPEASEIGLSIARMMVDHPYDMPSNRGFYAGYTLLDGFVLLMTVNILWQATRLKSWRKHYQAAKRSQRITAWLGIVLDLLVCTAILIFPNIGGTRWNIGLYMRPDFIVPLLIIAVPLGVLGFVKAVTARAVPWEPIPTIGRS